MENYQMKSAELVVMELYIHVHIQYWGKKVSIKVFRSSWDGPVEKHEKLNSTTLPRNNSGLNFHFGLGMAGFGGKKEIQSTTTVHACMCDRTQKKLWSFVELLKQGTVWLRVYKENY